MSSTSPDPRDIDLVIVPPRRDLGGFEVYRALPSAERRQIGPFVFFDEMGPTELDTERTLQVRPHPHINLATVTYLFEGEIIHRDSLGHTQVIRPGAINWMTAGRGIVHSERSPLGATQLHGLQLWCGLPTEHEETAPAFDHYPAETLPSITDRGVTVRVLAGTALGATSPVRTLSRLFYLDVHATSSATLAIPDDYPERAAYIVAGTVRCTDRAFERGTMVVFGGARDIRVGLDANTRLVLLGGDPLDGERHIEWNFVSSSVDRIERAKQAWRNQTFPKIPGDEHEFIPLPE